MLDTDTRHLNQYKLSACLLPSRGHFSRARSRKKHRPYPLKSPHVCARFHSQIEYFSLRLVDPKARRGGYRFTLKRQSEAIQQFFNLQSSIFNSGLSGLGFKSPAVRRTLPITFPLFPSLWRFFRPWPIIFCPYDWLLSQRAQWKGSVQSDTW